MNMTKEYRVPVSEDQISDHLKVQDVATDKVRETEKGTSSSLFLFAGALFVLWVFAGWFTIMMADYSIFGMCVGGAAFIALTIGGPVMLIQNIRKATSKPGEISPEKVARAFYEDFSPANTLMQPTRRITLTKMIAPSVVNNFDQDTFAKINQKWVDIINELKQQLLEQDQSQVKTGMLDASPELADGGYDEFKILVTPAPLRDDVATIKCRRLYKLSQKQSGVLQDKNVELGSAEVTYSNVAVRIQNRWYLVSPEPGELSQ